jgi:hypothetical protein
MDRLCPTESEVVTFFKATQVTNVFLSPFVFSVRQIDGLDEDACYVFKMAAIIPRVRMKTRGG